MVLDSMLWGSFKCWLICTVFLFIYVWFYGWSYRKQKDENDSQFWKELFKSKRWCVLNILAFTALFVGSINLFKILYKTSAIAAFILTFVFLAAGIHIPSHFFLSKILDILKRED